MNEIDYPKTFAEHKNKKYGEIGTPNRDEFERKARVFIIGELIKTQRHEAQLTQEQLAEKAGTKKSYISKIEKGQSDIQLSTLFRIIETGLGKQLNLSIL